MGDDRMVIICDFVFGEGIRYEEPVPVFEDVIAFDCDPAAWEKKEPTLFDEFKKWTEAMKTQAPEKYASFNIPIAQLPPNLSDVRLWAPQTVMTTLPNTTNTTNTTWGLWRAGQAGSCG